MRPLTNGEVITRTLARTGTISDDNPRSPSRAGAAFDWTPPGEDFECDGTGTGGLGGGTEADCGFDPALAFVAEGSVLQLQSQDGSFCAKATRRNEGGGSLENTNWSLQEITLGPLGEVATVQAVDDLCWYSSHHNFRDWAHIWTGSRHFGLVLKEDGHGGPRRYHLYGFEEGPLEPGTCPPTADGVGCIDGPVVLVPYEGRAAAPTGRRPPSSSRCSRDRTP